MGIGMEWRIAYQNWLGLTLIGATEAAATAAIPIVRPKSCVCANKSNSGAEAKTNCIPVVYQGRETSDDDGGNNTNNINLRYQS